MLFDTIEFLYFVVFSLCLYFTLKRRWQNVCLLVASYTFYAWWDWRFLSLIAFSTLVDFYLAQGMKNTDSLWRKRLLILSLISNLGLLGLFKYFNFFVDSFIELGATVGLNLDTPALRLVPPIGISFYTFQTLAYSIDVYRRRIEPETDLVCFAVFVSYFPQLVAGPIERADRLLPQFRNNRYVTTECVKSGLLLILIGLFKKIAIADSAGMRVNDIFNNPEELSSATLWKGAILFSIQIYGDFSGYSNIARGVSRLFGIQLTENFKTPYFARNISEFWRRWHITLSQWLRDYLYIPLGGSQHGTWITCRNLLTTMLLGGLWHGAAMTFVIWGFLQGIMLIVHRAWLGFKESIPLPRHSSTTGVCLAILSVLTTYLMVCLSFVIFRSNSGSSAADYLLGLFVWRGSVSPYDIMLPAALIGMLLPLEFIQFTHNDNLLNIHKLPLMVRSTLYSYMVLAIIYSASNEIPFIYFQF